MIGRHGIAQHSQHTRAVNIGHRRRRLRHAIEVRSLPDVGGVRLPLVDVARGKAEALPARIAIGNGRVLLAEPSLLTPLSIAAATSCCVGQMSLR